MIWVSPNRTDYDLLSKEINMKTLIFFIPDKLCNIESVSVKEIIYGPHVIQDWKYLTPAASLLMVNYSGIEITK